MALGFILFVIFCIITIFLSILAIIIMLISCKFLLKYKKTRKYKMIPLIFSLLGVLTSGLFLVFILTNVIRVFVLPTETTRILFKTNNGIKEVVNIAKIEQAIDSYGTYVRFHYFKEYREILPNRYNIKFYEISDNVKIIRINSIYLTVNGNKQDITTNNENREIVINDEIEDGDFGFYYNLRFDYKSVECITIIFDIEIELENEEIINIKETAEYKKEIVYEIQ